MEITDTSGPRFELLLDQLRAGAWLTRGNLTIGVTRGELECRIATLMQPEQANPDRAREQIGRGRAEFEALVAEAPLLATMAGTLSVRYVLVDNYGMGVTEIAQEHEGRFEWLVD